MADAKTEEKGEKSESSSLPAITEQERGMAQQATEEFNKGNLDAAMGILNKLSATRGADPRVMHNISIIEYYKSGFTKTDEFKRSLSDVCLKSQVNVENVAALDDVDQCVLYYNHAVILYHMRQYKMALASLDKLFQFIEPMDAQLSQQVMFLLVELYLCTQQPEKAMGMLGFLEKTLFGNGKSQQTPDKDGKDVKEKDNNKDNDQEGKSSSVNEALRPRISQYKARCYIMLKSMKSCKREVKNLMNSAGLSAPIIYLKSNFEYLRGNYRKAIKFLNSVPQPLKPTNETGESLATMFYNNLGVIHFYMRKHNLGAFYFRKALLENDHCCKEFNKANSIKTLSGRPIQTLGVSRHYELMYNMGIQLLHCGQPTVAFDCLIETIQVYRINPRLWLRLAECCIMAHRESNDEDRKLDKRLQVVRGSVGTGVHRKLIFNPGLQKDKAPTESAAIPMVNLEFASLCLQNALMLLPSDPLDVQVSSEDEQTDTRQSVENMLVPAPPSNPMRSQEVASLRCSILAASSYVALCLNDYLVALKHAEKLLRQPRVSGALKYLGHMYMGEALVALDKIAGAIEHLNPDSVTDISTLPPEQKQDQERGDKNGDRDPQEPSEAKGSLYPWSPKDLQQAKAIMQYNLATAHAIRGEYEKALLNLGKSTQSIGMPLPAQMYFLKIYLELMEGRRKIAQGIIKEHFGHVTPNRV